MSRALPTPGSNQVTCDIPVKLTNVRLWSPDDPFLYVLESCTGGDSVQTRFGMREFRLDPATGRLAYVTQPWPYALALMREPRAPDGNRTAMVADNDRRIPQVYVRDAQYGNVQKQLTTSTGMNYDPVWSPAEDRIAMVSEEPGNAEIYTIGADGNEYRRLTVNNWEWDKHPTWSPNGQKIAFVSQRDGNREIYVMDADCAGRTGAQVEVTRTVPATLNDEGATRFLFEALAAGSAGGLQRMRTLESPVMASEDFSVYGRHVPACFFFLGLGAPGRAAPGTATLRRRRGRCKSVACERRPC